MPSQAQAPPSTSNEAQSGPSPVDIIDQDGAESFSSATSAPEVAGAGQEAVSTTGKSCADKYVETAGREVG